MVFTLFRYGLLPFVLYGLMVVVFSIHIYGTHAVHKATWPQTVVTVTQSQDWGDEFARFRGTQNTFPDPRGTGTYVVDGTTYTWQGRGRELGVTVMKPGDAITVFYNPKDPKDLEPPVLLGAFTGNIIISVTLAFLGFYVWFFWVRRFVRRSGPDDFGDNLAPSGPRAAAISTRPVGQSFGRSSGAT